MHKVNKFCIENWKQHLFCNEKFSLKRHLIWNGGSSHFWENGKPNRKKKKKTSAFVVLIESIDPFLRDRFLFLQLSGLIDRSHDHNVLMDWIDCSVYVFDRVPKTWENKNTSLLQFSFHIIQIKLHRYIIANT